MPRNREPTAEPHEEVLAQQLLALQGALRQKEELAAAEEGGGAVLALDEPLLEGLRAALEQPADRRERAIREAVFYLDPLCTLAAGEGDTLIPTRPVWFTGLLTCPATIAWDDDSSHAPWQVRLWNAQGIELHREQTLAPHFEVPRAVASVVPPETDLRWEVRHAQTPHATLTCGVFRLLAPERMTRVTARLRELASAAPGIARDLMTAQVQHQAGLFDAAVEHLKQVCEQHRSGGGGFLVRRALANTYLAIRRELTGERNLGQREGLWATQLANTSLAAAYHMLGIKFQFDD